MLYFSYLSRLGSLSKDSTAGSGGGGKLESKKSEEREEVKPVEPDQYGGNLVQRCVIIQRDEKGYGLTVSGDNPVFVQSVKESKYHLKYRKFSIKGATPYKGAPLDPKPTEVLDIFCHISANNGPIFIL